MLRRWYVNNAFVSLNLSYSHLQYLLVIARQFIEIYRGYWNVLLARMEDVHTFFTSSIFYLFIDSLAIALLAIARRISLEEAH